MEINKLIKKIEKDYKLISAYDFDNTGANIVDYNSDISGILVCLDVSIDAIEYAKANNCNLIISHHPLTFDSYKNLNSDIQSKKIKKIIKNNINAYSIHTNFDVNIKKGMGKLVVEKIFKNCDIKKESYIEERIVDNKRYALGNIITLKKEMNIDELYEKVLKSLDLNKDFCSLYKGNNNIKKIAIVPGSGSGEIYDVIKLKVDCFITSDLKHNQILDLLDSNVSYINTTHYGAEKVFIDYMYKYLKSKVKVDVYKYYDERL